MNKILIIGGSKGIGRQIINELISDNEIINYSRTVPEISHANLTHFTIDVLKDDLPEIKDVSTIIYCPGSINLKPIGRFSLDEFREDFEILSVIKLLILKYISNLKRATNASILLFSTVATKLGMPYHSSLAILFGEPAVLKGYGRRNTTLNAIAPTITNTDLASKLLRNEKAIDSMVERHPLKKILDPKDVAKMAKFLISEDASAISGQTFNLDAGIVSFKI